MKGIGFNFNLDFEMDDEYYKDSYEYALYINYVLGEGGNIFVANFKNHFYNIVCTRGA